MQSSTTHRSPCRKSIKPHRRPSRPMPRPRRAKSRRRRHPRLSLLTTRRPRLCLRRRADRCSRRIQALQLLRSIKAHPAVLPRARAPGSKTAKQHNHRTQAIHPAAARNLPTTPPQVKALGNRPKLPVKHLPSQQVPEVHLAMDKFPHRRPSRRRRANRSPTSSLASLASVYLPRQPRLLQEVNLPGARQTRLAQAGLRQRLPMRSVAAAFQVNLLVRLAPMALRRPVVARLAAAAFQEILVVRSLPMALRRPVLARSARMAPVRRLERPALALHRVRREARSAEAASPLDKREPRPGAAPSQDSRVALMDRRRRWGHRVEFLQLQVHRRRLRRVQLRRRWEHGISGPMDGVCLWERSLQEEWRSLSYD